MLLAGADTHTLWLSEQENLTTVLKADLPPWNTDSKKQEVHKVIGPVQQAQYLTLPDSVNNYK